ncbi:MAG: tryptophan--tRNA ligase [Nanoarchaeota archaeon]|nr:tryptophan--tRNA ligase [Nanoarchaeota archaeon]MBU4299755.1 tryptophan--tRNA ligase [Nanoarchaeota archaeon]MBU4452569.1 tryptophan--tRNA ligase [Nanoarchaeota archaeon]MCG2723534.1 tryptophan--tRNA ligase [archaeon]
MVVQKVTPWEVEGTVDYDKLIKEFGTKPVDAQLKAKIEKITGESNIFMRRGFYYSHRDMDLILKDYESGKGFFLYNGIATGGEIHIGHLISFIFAKWLQDKFKVNYYIQIPDEEKFLFKQNLNWEDMQNRAMENALHLAALGFDPDRTFMFRNTEYIKQMYPIAMKVAKKVNYSTVKAVFGFNDQSNIGMIFYPALQIVPTFFENKRCLIPAGIDQDNYWRPQRDIAESLGGCKTAAMHNKFLPPLTGISGKMSASAKDTAIYLSDDEKTVKQKVMKYAFSGGQPTVEEHRKLGGNPDIDVSFQWLSILFEEDDKKLEQIREDYKSGKLLSGEMKQILIEKLNAFLREHKKKKENAKALAEKIMYSGKLAQAMWKC